MQSGLRISKPVIFLCLFLLVAQFIYGANTVRTSYSARFFLVYSLAFYWALGWWFINDARNHGIKWVDNSLDMGMFLYVGWIFLIPYYLFKTRGWKAIYTIGLLLSACIGAYIAGVILSALLLNLF